MSLAAYALAIAAATSAPVLGSAQFAQQTIRQRVVVRIPALPVRPMAPTRWREKKGPKCVPMNAMAGAAITRPDAVDLILRGGGRFRAQLADECPALDYYRGFYVNPTKDGQLCADRDTIHSRAGGECEIERFRVLVPEK